MKSRIVAIILTVILTVTLAACGKKNTTTDPAKELPKFGFREYTVDYITGDRALTVKYENLGTERTLTKYDEEGEISSIEKWYYDNTGEHLCNEQQFYQSDIGPDRTLQQAVSGRCLPSAQTS